jgi:hypothetical protein
MRGRIPESLAAVAMKALSLRREDRYQSVPELQKDIEAYQGGFATGAEQASAWLLVKRHKKEFALAGVALVELLGTVTGFLVKVTKKKTGRRRTNVRRRRHLNNVGDTPSSVAKITTTWKMGSPNDYHIITHHVHGKNVTSVHMQTAPTNSAEEADFLLT